ncbi:MAG TPA: biosynthetic-type acetolactate synthase large subunit, partial [Pseudomonadales bacterium]|nr:biosynthetic-type acetolactate synthase large subunit [Pseudomonadales bacterium]
MELLSGADMLIRSLKEEGVELIFGYPGGTVLHIYDALYRHKTIEHFLVRHEQAAAHMADGYARVTGKVGVVLATSGPGATNTVTGIATAYMDSIPMVILSGQVPSHLVGEDAFQETDMLGVSRPIVKHSFSVKSAEQIPQIIKKAFHIASTGRKGPVLIDLPKNVTNPADLFEYVNPGKVNLRSYTPVSRGHSGQIKKAVDEILKARRPIIYSGGGVVQGNAAELLVELVQVLDFPITSTLMGLGAYPGEDKQFLGMLGMHGTYEANMAMHHSDLIIAIGARFDDRVTNNTAKFCPDAKIVHIDIDPASISKTITADVPIVGAVDQVLTDMIAQLKRSKEHVDQEALSAWWLRIEGWRAKGCLKYRVEAGEQM